VDANNKRCKILIVYYVGVFNMTDNFSDNEVKVVVSGRTVYRAIKNYLNNTMKGQIKKDVEAYMAKIDLDRTVADCVNRVVNEELSHATRRRISQAIDKALAENLANRLKISIIGTETDSE